MAPKKITLPELANLLALESGDSSELCLTFLRSFLKTVTESLEAGDSNIKIKGFGEFRIVDVGKRMSIDVSSGAEIEIPPHRKVVFIPSKRLASLVNSPFNMFEATELNDNIDEDDFLDDQLDIVERESNDTELEIEEPSSVTIDSDTDTFNKDIHNSEDELDLVNKSDSNSDDSDDSNNGNEDIENEVSLTTPPIIATNDTADTSEQSESEIREESIENNIPAIVVHEKGYKFLWGFFSGFISAVVVVAIGAVVYLMLHGGNLSFNNYSVIVQEEQLENHQDASIDQTQSLSIPLESEKDSLKSTENESGSAHQDKIMLPESAVDTHPSDEKVIDTITKTRYLTTMARDHYGNYNLWPYIYIENQAILGHPDRIRPGTDVVIPPLSKYGVDPNSEEDIKEAKKKGVEIYSRYK